MPIKSGNIYRFIGLHSFLIGLFPFYIPVYLWKTGTSLSGIAFFVSLTGLGFCITLWVWDRLRQRVQLKGFVLLSFLLEVLLLSIVFWDKSRWMFLVFALVNGAYNGFFWTTQRVLFFNTIRLTNSGEKFGNLQIIVALCLKSGIFIGGLVLDKLGFSSVFLFSSLVALLAIGSFIFGKQASQFPNELVQTKPLNLKKILAFTDNFRSKPVFILDGLFLFLESYFWMISMFLIVKESFWELGILVITLMVLFTIIFLVIKNSIDRLPATLFYGISVILYAVSWVLRGLINGKQDLFWMFVLLVLISFFTSLFRLTYNKRFFDLAISTSKYHYLILKSYYSQAAIVVFFGVMGAVMSTVTDPALALQVVYFIAAFQAGGYALYGKKETKSIYLKPVVKKIAGASPGSNNSVVS